MNRLAVLILLVMASCLRAHSLHQSTAEAEYNAETKRLEISVTMFVDDLELALIRHSERLMSLQKTPAKEFDAQIRSYVAKSFIVTDASGKVAEVEWVGRESEGGGKEPTITIYFSVHLTKGTRGVLIKSNLLDIFSDQINLMRLRIGTRITEIRLIHDKCEVLP